MIPTLLSAGKWALSHWRTVTVGLIVLALVLTWQDNRRLRARVGELTAKNAQATESIQRSEDDRKKLETELAKVKQKLEAAQKSADAAKARTQQVAREAAKRATQERRAYKARVSELKKRLDGMTECQKCEEAMRWLEEEVCR